MDFISVDLMGGVLYRTGTLAEGAEKCDFYVCKKDSKWDKERKYGPAIQAAKTGRVGQVEYVTVAQEGFYGLYHVPVKDHDPKKVVIVVGGSDGNENIPMNVGAYVSARCGIAALGICYWNVDGLPKELVRVPVDPFEKAILWLKKQRI